MVQANIQGFTDYDWLAEYDPDYETARRAVSARIWTPADAALIIAGREMVAAAVLSTRHYPTVPVHFRRSMRHGSTLRQLLEAMQAAASAGGPNVLRFALPFLRQVEDELAVEIDETLPDAETEGLPTGEQRGASGSSFADIDIEAPPTGALPSWTRELIMVAVLAYRHDHSIDHHLRRALREGATFRHLVETMQTTAVPAGSPALHFSMPYLHRLKTELEATGVAI